MFLKRNLALKIICILISIGLWVFVKYTQSPLVVSNNYQTSLYVPISYVNTPENLKLVSSPEQVMVSVKGVPDIINNINPSAFRATVDLVDQREGRDWLDVTFKSPPGVTVTDIQPSKVNITLESYAEKQLQVDVVLHGDPKDGFDVKNISYEPKMATITGLKSLVSKVATVSSAIHIEDRDADTREIIPLVALDSSGIPVDVKISPERLNVFLDISAGYSVQTIPIAPIFGTLLPKGYILDKFELEPSFVSVKIKDGVTLRNGVIRTVPINLGYTTESKEMEAKLFIPKNVEIIDGSSTIKVKIYVRKGGS